MYNKYGGKVRLTFKLELDQLWIGTKGIVYIVYGMGILERCDGTIDAPGLDLISATHVGLAQAFFLEKCLEILEHQD